MAKSPLQSAIDAGFNAYVTDLFAAVARQMAGGHVEEARKALRTGMSVAMQTHNEMSLHAAERADAKD